jgi:Kef-type K+ transport system membrane component KefB
MTPTEWVAVTLGIGVAGGVLFHLFLGRERHVDRLFISLGGGVILVSGAASYVRVSPLLAALCFGAILVNTSRSRAEIAAALERVERPFYFVLLVFAGAAWRPSASSWVLPVLLFLAARTAGKLGGARLAARSSGLLPVLGPNWGRALLGQGPLALAIALNYVYQGGGSVPYVVFTAAVASVLLTDLLSPQLVHSVLAPLVAERELQTARRVAAAVARAMTPGSVAAQAAADGGGAAGAAETPPPPPPATKGVGTRREG